MPSPSTPASWQSQKTIKGIVKRLSIREQAAAAAVQRDLFTFFMGIVRKQRQSSHQLQKSGEENLIPSMPYMLLEKSTHYISLAFPPPYRKAMVTAQKDALDLHWYYIVRSEDEKSFGSAVRQSWT